MTVKAKLKVILKADNVVIAESDDSALWQNVFQSINRGALPEASAGVESGQGLQGSQEWEDLIGQGASPLDNALRSFAKTLSLEPGIVEGACDPSMGTPYIHLDRHYWEALVKALPKRGPKSIAGIVIAATILCFWKEKAGLGDTTTKEAYAVLKTIHLATKHINRSINNCEWLRLKAGGIVTINPAHTTRALNVVRGYCMKQDPYTV